MAENTSKVILQARLAWRDGKWANWEWLTQQDNEEQQIAALKAYILDHRGDGYQYRIVRKKIIYEEIHD